MIMISLVIGDPQVQNEQVIGVFRDSSDAHTFALKSVAEVGEVYNMLSRYPSFKYYRVWIIENNSDGEVDLSHGASIISWTKGKLDRNRTGHGVYI